MINNKINEWDKSYTNRDNFLFYPDEEMIVFFSKYIIKRVGFTEFKSVIDNPYDKKVLDLGCGIGRHVIYAHKLGLESYGVDLSAVAIEKCKEWAIKENISNYDEKIIQHDIRHLPWSNNYFDIIISNAVLDSMSSSIAKEAINEVYRILKPAGLFYCTLISGNDSTHAREFAGEELITSKHEEGTIQSYFNFSKLNDFFKDRFEILECKLIKKEDVIKNYCSSRYHVVLKKN